MLIFTVESLYIVYGEDYKYNFTKDELDEYRLVELCYNLHKSDMAISMLEQFCSERYGKLNTEWGEPIK
jgi:hypothetical protein